MNKDYKETKNEISFQALSVKKYLFPFYAV